MVRSLGKSPMLERIVPLSWKSRSVSRVCLAYEAYRSRNQRRHFPTFLQEGLELFKCRLRQNDIQDDEVLVTGLLLCSVSVSTPNRYVAGSNSSWTTIDTNITFMDSPFEWLGSHYKPTAAIQTLHAA